MPTPRWMYILMLNKNKSVWPGHTDLFLLLALFVFYNHQVDGCLLVAHLCGLGKGALGGMAVMASVLDDSLQVEHARVVLVGFQLIEQSAIIGCRVVHQLVYNLIDDHCCAVGVVVVIYTSNYQLP